MDYVVKDKLNWFQQSICAKSIPLKDVSLSTIGIFWKIAIIFVLVWAIVTTSVNLAAYAKILNEPDNDQNLSSSWCIAMLIFNGMLLLVSLGLTIVVILSFKKDADNKKVVEMQSVQNKNNGAKEGAAIGAMAAAETTAVTTSAAAGDAAGSVVLTITGDRTLADNVARTAQAAALNAGMDQRNKNMSIDAALNNIDNAINNGSLDETANSAISNMPTRRIGSLGKPPFPTTMEMPNNMNMNMNMNFPGGPPNSIFNKTAEGKFRKQASCLDGSDPPCGYKRDYITNLNHDLYTNPNERFLPSDPNFLRIGNLSQPENNLSGFDMDFNEGFN